MQSNLTPAELRQLGNYGRLDELTPGQAVTMLTHAMGHLQQHVRRSQNLEQHRAIAEATDILEALRLLILYTVRY